MSYTKLTPDQVKLFLQYMINNPIPEDLKSVELRPIKSHETDGTNTSVKYPSVQATKDDPPVASQKYAVISFDFNDENVRKAQKASDIMAVIKVRYVASTKEQAETFCDEITRKHDSLFPKCIVEVGKWTKLSASLESKDEKLIADDQEQQHLLQQMYNDKVEQREKDIEDVEERRKQALKDAIENPDKPYDHMSLDHYVTKRVSKWNIDRHLATFREQKRQYKRAKTALKRICTEIANIEKEHPEYLSTYKERYEQERRALGFTEHPSV